MNYRPPGFFALPSRIAGLVACASFALAALVTAPCAGAPQVTRVDALPRPSELLSQPIWLPHCRMRVVEWRATAAWPDETTASEQALAVMDDTCRAAFARYGAFLRDRKLPSLRATPQELPAISLLPGNTLIDGKSARALNDLPTRFQAVAPGCCYWGLYVDSLNHLFLRNDPLVRNAKGELVPNIRFVRTFTHEISHILSSRLGVWNVLGYDRQHDENLAEDFVAFMDMHFPAESSAEDLAFHHAGSAHTKNGAAVANASDVRGTQSTGQCAGGPESLAPHATASTSEQR